VFIPVKNDPGELMRIDKSRLRVDHDYQRSKVDYIRVARYAANWSWVSCGALIVSKRSEDFFAIVDGQHRWEAAKLIETIRELPCLVFPLDQLRDEAIGFLAVNTERKMPSLADQIKALLIAGNEDAILADKLAKQAGRHIAAGTGPYTVACAAEFLRLIQADSAAVEACWPALAGVCQGQALSHKILRGVVTLQRRMPKGHSFAEERWRERLIYVGWHNVTEEIKRLGAIEHNYSELVCASGVLRAINKGLRIQLQVDLSRR